MKTCFKCNLTQSIEFFHKTKNICKKCNNENVKNYYNSNTEYKQTVKDRALANKHKIVNAIQSYKAFYGCSLCKESNPVCLHFHHLDPSKKSFGIHGGSKRSLSNFRNEIEKCDILCSNCHIKLHANIFSFTNPRKLDSSILELYW
jgi:hypothetical protein